MNVYVGDYGTYSVPESVLKQAAAMNCGKSLNDKRTKGARMIAHWGRCQDSDQALIHGIKKHLLNE